MDFVSCLLLLGAILLWVNLLQGKTSLKDYFELKKSHHRLSVAVRNLELEIAKLEDEILKLKTSKDYVRKVLKDRYHLTESNERILFFDE